MKAYNTPLTLLSLAVLLAIPSATSARQQGAASATGTIVIAHGGGEEWNARVKAIIEQVSTGGPVEVSFLMGPEARAFRFQDAVARLLEADVREIVVVPLLVSSHSGHYDQIRYLTGELDAIDEAMMHHLHMAGIERAAAPVPILLARAIDNAPDVARALADRALGLADSPDQQALFLIGHGPNSMEDHAEWMKNLREIADSVFAATGFRDVRVGVVQDDAPAAVRTEAVRRVRDIIELQAGLTGRPVVVVPFVISTGRLTDTKLPADLAGLPIVYSGEALLPHPAMALWIETRVREASGTTPE